MALNGFIKNLFLLIIGLSIAVLLLIILDVVFSDGSLTGNVIGDLSDMTNKLACKDQIYNKIEINNTSCNLKNGANFTNRW